MESIQPELVVQPADPIKPFRIPSATQTATPVKMTDEGHVLRKGMRIQIGAKSVKDRPESSPGKHVSILQTARSIETLPPNDPRFPSAVQEESNLRLFRGSRYESTPRPETLSNPLFKYSSIVGEHNLESKQQEVLTKEKATHDHFTQSIRFLPELVFDLDLNYDIAHGNEQKELPEPSQLGGFYRLQEEMEKAVNMPVDALLKESVTSYSAKLSDYSKIVRGVLRGLRKKDMENECILVELLWKVVIKMFDSAIDIHQHTLNDAIEIMKYKVRSEVESRRKEVNDLRSKWLSEENRYKEQVKRLDQVVTVLQGQKLNLEIELSERQEELTKITEGTQKFKVVQEMHQWAEKLTNYLNESEAEQLKQAAALEGIEAIMNAAKEARQQAERKSAETQTDPV